MANYAYYLFHRNNIRPTEFLSMSREEQAMLMAMVDLKIDEERKEEKKLKSKSRKRG